MGQITEGNDPQELEERDDVPARRRPSDSEPPIEAADSAAGQLGVNRFVYAAFLGGAVLVSYLFTKITEAIWHKAAQSVPTLGEPQEESVYLVASVIGVGLAVFFYRKKGSRAYVEEVATELSKVTWPTKKEVYRSTLIVVITTLVATAFFSVMDQFWRFVTDHVYAL